MYMAEATASGGREGRVRAACERKIRPTGSSVTARVGIGRMENGRFSLKVDDTERQRMPRHSHALFP